MEWRRRFWLNALSLLVVLSLLMPLLPTAPEVAAADAGSHLHMAFVGDVMLGRHVGEVIGQRGSSFPFKGTRDYLAGADLTFCNLECSLTDEPTPYLDKSYQFKARPGVERGLSDAGFDVVSLANNHIMDYGPGGANDTVRYLADSDLKQVGLWHGKDAVNDTPTRPLMIPLCETTIGFLAYTENIPSKARGRDAFPGPCPMDEAQMQKDIEYAVSKVDVLVVSLHWVYSPQYNTTQLPRQVTLSHKVIDWGADLIIGEGPHVLQDAEGYHGGLIMYSLGNFVFDIKEGSDYLEQYPELPYSCATEMNDQILSSVIADVEIRDSKLITLRITPVSSYYNGIDDPLGEKSVQPRVVGDSVSFEISDDLSLSARDMEVHHTASSEPPWHIVLWWIVLIVSLAVNLFILYMVLLHKPKDGKGGMFKRLLED